MTITKPENHQIAIVGLGNPGLSYQKNRHNIGYNFLNYLAKKLGGSEWKINKRCLAQISLTDLNNQKIILAKPTVFMNQSGKTVDLIRKFYNLSSQDIFIAHDDTDIRLGDFKIQYGRGSAGHKGVESIIQHLKSKYFYRLRIGVRPSLYPSFPRQKAEKLVLKNFNDEENQKIEKIFPIIEEALMKTYILNSKQSDGKPKPKKYLKSKHLRKDN
ncbi:MAG: aminoacyl-tRNA hydrolase [Candidatus Pacebacteria bacterium]|nr:aminoacyl-tRNA hydrolase [Candidatus Paceibacterota bacterium]